MIKRIIEISREPAHLAVKLDQLLIIRDGQPTGSIPQVPCEDIGVVLVDHPQVTYSHQALAKLAEHGAAVLICGRDHLPVSMMLPLSDHTEVVWRVREQIEASKPTLKQLWRQLVIAKVENQARNLDTQTLARGQLTSLIGDVRSGDPENIEGHAARIYWPHWIGKGHPAKNIVRDSFKTDEAFFAAQSLGEFRRDQEATDPLNVMLNYGYAIMRAAVARALVGAGLVTAIGLHHRNRSNAFCLADDVIEPLRPMVDARVRDLYLSGVRELNRESKGALLELLHTSVCVEGQTGPLMVGLHRVAASLVRCYRGEKKQLSLPEWS